MKLRPAALLFLGLAGGLAGCAPQLSQLQDPDYQPATAGAMPYMASVALEPARPWTTGYVLSRSRTTTYVVGGEQDTVRWPSLVWGPAVEQDLTAEFQNEFTTVLPQPNGTEDFEVRVAPLWLDLAKPQDMPGTSMSQDLLGRALLQLRVSLISRRTGTFVRGYHSQVIIPIPYGSDEQVGEAVLTGIRRVTHGVGGLMKRDPALPSLVSAATSAS